MIRVKALRSCRCLAWVTACLAVTVGAQDFPIVPEDFVVSLFAREPLVRNPCVIAFDAQGRLCVGMGPQYRAPKPDSPPDSIWILTDADGDGQADERKQFATGFNCIQGLAWQGDWLWVANAPELTRVRDVDGDDVADEYVRVYTDLGNLEHGLHGLNVGPDGMLYMSKGNSKGLTQPPTRLAPAPFRELWGVAVPAATQEPKPATFSAQSYRKNYHDPRDDWGITGGILRCDRDGRNLEIVCRGLRNPWDVAFDDRFDWLGTDNDQTMGDKIFAPFYGAHFGWGHAWSYDWKGDFHLPTAPSSGPLFEGSGAGVVYCNVAGYPEEYRDVFLICDWLNRELMMHRTRWRGAWRQADRNKLETLAHAGGGRSMASSSGRAFDPVDVEIGPDGAIWITSWGRQYGAHYEDGKLANEGRIYRLWPKAYEPKVPTRSPLADLGSAVPAWRSAAQETFLRRGEAAMPELRQALASADLSTRLETWLIWTMGRIDPDFWADATLNQRLQSLRVAAFNGVMKAQIGAAMRDAEARVRLEGVLAWRQLGGDAAPLIELAAAEQDRVVFYAAWQALLATMPKSERKDLLADGRASVRLAAVLSLLEEDGLTDREIAKLGSDSDPRIAAVSAKRLAGKHKFAHRGRPIATAVDAEETPPIVVPFTEVTASSGRSYTAATLRAGARYYTDRPYRMTRVPAELDGLVFLRTACGDADAESGITVSLTLKYPATVYFLDDARAENLPRWARGKWQATSLVVEGDDPKAMKVYRAELPAGRLTLGTSRDGIRARKGNYLLAVRPRLLAPDGKTADLATVMAALGQADPERGRDLFFSKYGANCAACHQVDGRGNNHAPDLSEIASRADAATLITSVLDPSADVVEGFAAQLIKTRAGKHYAGVILEETGRHLTIAQMGAATKIPRAQIVEREGLAISAMPPGFGVMMSSAQLADLTAWLLTLKAEKPLRRSVFQFREDQQQLHLHFGQTRIATYLKAHPKLTRRAFVNLRTPSGISVTRNFPPRKPVDLDPGYGAEDGIIHPVMHPGLWMSFGWLAGNDYWRLRSRVSHQGYLQKPQGNASEAVFGTRDHYLGEDGREIVCIQDSRYHFRKLASGVLLDWDATFYNDERDFAFGDQEESGLAVRIASGLRVRGGNGGIINDRGERDGDGTWGKPFSWISYSGAHEGRQVGLLLMPHPDNPCWSHSRDYGALVANPFPKQPRERRQPYVTTTVKKGERFRLRYSILIHEVAAEDFDPAALAATVTGQLPPSPRLETDAAGIARARRRLAGGQEPFASYWQLARQEAKAALTVEPAPSSARDSLVFHNAARDQGSAARLLAYQWQLENDLAAGERALLLLDAWASAEPLPGTAFDRDVRFPNVGMDVARGTLPFVAAYDLLRGHPALDGGRRQRIENWFRALAEVVTEGIDRWEDNDDFGGQEYQNHHVAHMLGLAAFGSALGDRKLLRLALDSPANPKDFRDLLAGLILMPGDAPRGGLLGKPLHAGELQDRERTKQGKGLVYCHLSLTMMLYAAEILGRATGEDLLNERAPGGENLQAVATFYSDFFRLRNAGINGGYYGRDHAAIQNNQPFLGTFEVALGHWPEVPNLKAVVRSTERARTPRHWLSYYGLPLLTHGVEQP